MSETIYHRYRLKRRTTAGWAANNEVLLAGEPGIEVLVDGTEKIKYGDGVKTWAQLSYAAGGGGAGAAWLQGAGVPASNLGKVGDFYLRTSNGDVYGPKSDTWGAVVANLASTVGIGTVTTAPAGEPAMVSNSGTAMDPVFDFRLPRGDDAALSNATPQALGTAAAGTSAEASRADHRHQMPTAGQVGADASGTAAAAVAAHAAAADPHPGYALEGAHKATHATGGTDALSPADIGAATAAQGAKADSAVQPAGLTKAAVGLGNADNTSDADKPVSTATATALGGKAGTGAIGSSGLTMATARLLGRTTAGAGAVEEIQVSGGTFAAGVLTISGLPSSLTADANGNLTFSARWIQSTNGAASAPAHALTGTWFTGGTGTTTKPQFLIEPAGTTSNNWSTAGTGFGVNAPSGFGGNLLDLQTNGVSNFRYSESLFRFTIKNTSATPSVEFREFGSSSCQMSVNSSFGIDTGANPISINTSSHIYLGTGTGYVNIGPSSLDDLRLYRDGPGAFAQRRAASPQTHRIYNTFTDASNYERLAHTWVSNVCYTRPENAGTGSARLYVPVTGGTTVANLPAAATAGTGARSFVTDANATTFLSTVAGGGSNRVPVVSDGTNWLIA